MARKIARKLKEKGNQIVTKRTVSIFKEEAKKSVRDERCEMEWSKLKKLKLEKEKTHRFIFRR